MRPEMYFSCENDKPQPERHLTKMSLRRPLEAVFFLWVYATYSSAQKKLNFFLTITLQFE